MKIRTLVAGLGVLLAACANAPERNLAASCAAPRLVASPLVIGDGARDRGFPGGVSLIDVDNDGDLDLMVTGGYSPTMRPLAYRPNTLYLNDGAGSFSHATDPVFSQADNPHSGSAWGDVDGDGDLDAFITTQHRKRDVFLRNVGGGRFAREPLGEATEVESSNFSGVWADIDGDGDLDLTAGGPTLELASPLLHYRNDSGVFTRVTGTPIENGVSNPGGVIWADFDNDGDVDLLVANSDILRRSNLAPGEHESAQLYRNDGAWRFVRTEGQAFSDIAFASTAAAVGDIDADGDLDVYLSQYQGRDRIFLNDGAGRFTLDARFEGPHHEQWGTGAALADFDGDGDLDLLATAYDAGLWLYVNDGAGAFAPADAALAERRAFYAGMATGDIDGDGDLDAVSGNWGDTAEGDFITILRNESAPCGRQVRLRLRDRAGAPDPLGARVTLVSRGPGGEVRQLRESMGATAIRSQSGDYFFFAAPPGARVLYAEIRWPNGRTQRVTRFDSGITEVRAPD